jgi:hypothetical protein
MSTKETIRKGISVEKRWITSVLMTIILSSVILVLTIDFWLYHALNIFTNEPYALSGQHFAIVVGSAFLMLVLSVVAFVDYFSFGITLRVRRQVAITKKEMQELKERGR